MEPVDMNDIEVEVSQEGPPATKRTRRGRWSFVHEAVLALADNSWLKIKGLSELNAKSLRTSVQNQKTAERVVVVSNDDPDNGVSFTVWILRSANDLVDSTNEVDTTSLGGVESFIAGSNEADEGLDMDGLVVDLTE